MRGAGWDEGYLVGGKLGAPQGDGDGWGDREGRDVRHLEEGGEPWGEGMRSP